MGWVFDEVAWVLEDKGAWLLECLHLPQQCLDACVLRARVLRYLGHGCLGAQVL